MNWLAILLAMSMFGTSLASNQSGSRQTYTEADVQTALERARELQQEGKYQQALDLHLWYHNNALKYDQSQYGVRLSFALDDWVDLGRVYPPALHELRVTRNQALVTYKKSPDDSLMFGEVMSIDLALKDMASAKSLFYLGRKSGVDDDGTLILELDKIVNAGDLKWSKDIIGDPAKRLGAIKSERAMSRAALSDHKDLADSSDGMFAIQIANLLRAVSKVFGPTEARKLQKKALGFLDLPQVRNALG